MTRSQSDSSLVGGDTIGGHFVIRRKLGGGGMGEVFLAENLNVPDKKYAIKVLRREFSDQPRFVAMLRDEATKQSRLEHDNVVGMYDFLLWKDHYCLIQSYVEGKSLADMIAGSPGGLPLTVALPLMTGILSGLDHAHKIGILHCDVKPANVIVAKEDSRPRVTDFGISRDVGGKSRDSGVVGAGTAEYMSPEQVLSPYEIDHRSDVFSAGVLFFEMLCGRLPFDVDPEQHGAALPQLHQDAPDVRALRPDIPEPIARIVATALQRDPALRFQGCGDFRKAIADYLWWRRFIRILVPSLAVACVIAIVGTFFLLQWREGVNREARIKREQNEREAAMLAATTANEALVNVKTSLNLLCRELNEYRAREPGLELARQAGDPDRVEKFRVRLSDMKANMDQYATKYGEAMRQLSSTGPDVVAAAITRRSNEPEFQAMAGSIKADEAGLRQRGTLVSVDDLKARCPAGTQTN